MDLQTRTRANLTIAGLGPGPKPAVSLGAWQALQEAEFVILRTETHPMVSMLIDEGIQFVSCDDIYEEEPDREIACEKIVERVMQAASSGLSVTYAVPGHPCVLEHTTRRLVERARETGLLCTVAGSESHIEPVLCAFGADISRGVAVLDSSTLKPGSLDQVRHLPVIILHAHLTDANALRSVLSGAYGAEYSVRILCATGAQHEVKIANLSAASMDKIGLSGPIYIYAPPVQDHPARFVLDPLMKVVSRLRGEGGCPWDREQTHMSLRSFVLEEAYEVVEAIELGEMNKLCEELGDLLLQIALHAQIASEKGAFDINDVVEGIRGKMVRRHPHVFGDAIVNDSQEVLERWQQIKSEERQHKPVSALGDVPAHLPALMRAQHVQKQAQKIGFDWEDAAPVFTKVREELDELVQAAEGCTTAELEDEIGDLLFSVVNLSRHMGVAAEVALTAAVSKFVTRFRYIEEAAAESGKDIHSMSLAQMDDLWNSAKKRGL